MAAEINKRTRNEAKKLMWEYYRDNKASLPGWIREFREEVIAGLMTGMQAAHIFETIIINVESDTEEVKAA